MNSGRTKTERRKPVITRRAFSTMLAGGFAGGGLLNAAMQEVRAFGTLSSDRVRNLLAYLGHPAKNASEVERMRPLLEDTLRAIHVIRGFEVPLDLEPAFVFHADR